MTTDPPAHGGTAGANRTAAVRTRVWRHGVLEAEDFPLEQVSDYLEQDDCLVWADVCSPDRHAIAQLAEELSLDPHAVEDALDAGERPKASRFATHTLLVTDTLAYTVDAGEVRSTHVSAFVLHRAMVTVRLDPGFDVRDLIARFDDNTDLIKHGALALVHCFLDLVVDQYADALQAMDEEIEELEEVLFDSAVRRTNSIQRRSFAARKCLMQMRRVINPMRDVVTTVQIKGTAAPDSDALQPYFDDLHDHILRDTETVEMLRESMASIFQTNMALSDNHLNEIMKTLTSWAAIVAVPTAVTGFFGQNVPYPGYGTHWGFVVSDAVMIVLVAGLYLLLKRRGWL